MTTAFVRWPELIIGLVAIALIAMAGLACGPFSPAGQDTAPSAAPALSPEQQERADELEKLASDRRYDAIGRVMVRSFQDITVPVDEIDWSPYRAPEFDELRLHGVELVETYDGTLPEQFTVFTTDSWPARRMDVNQEYVLVLTKSHARRENPEDEFERWYFDPAQLEAVGGEAYEYDVSSAWVVVGEQAWRVPERFIRYGSGKILHLDLGRQSGQQLSLAALKDAVTKGATGSALASPAPDLFVVGPEPPRPPPTAVRGLPSLPPVPDVPRTAPSQSIPSPSDLAEEVRVHMQRDGFDAAVRARVGQSRKLDVPLDVFDTAHLLPPEAGKYLRQTLEIVRTYRGEAFMDPEIAILYEVSPALVLDEDEEYILFIRKRIVHKDDYPFDSQRSRLRQDQLDALGGEGFGYDFNHAWIIDGDKVHKVPSEHLRRRSIDVGVTHMMVARENGETLPLATIEASLGYNPLARVAQGPPTPTPTPTPLNSVELMVRDGQHDAVARVRVLSHTDVVVPIREIEWPEEATHQPHYSDWRRSNLEVVEAFWGDLPDRIDAISDLHARFPNYALEVGREYILFFLKRWVLPDEHPDDTRRIHYSQEQLNAIGGAGYLYNVTQAWIIEGETAWRIPREALDGGRVSHLNAGRNHGDPVAVEQLQGTIRAEASQR